MNGLARSKSVHTGAILITLGAAGLVLGGCQTARPSDRVDPYSRPGDGALNDPAVSPRTLLEFTDQVTQNLADRLPRVPEIGGAPAKVVIAVGDITNRTRTPSSDFLTVRSQIFTDLVNSNVQQHAIILETLETMDGQVNRYAQRGGADRLDEATRGTLESARYDPAITYILNGEFGEISRDSGRDSTYVFNWRLVNLKTSAVVFADRVTSTQTRTR
jgi:hypothetical protein